MRITSINNFLHECLYIILIELTFLKELILMGAGVTIDTF